MTEKTLGEWREDLGLTVEEVARHMQVTERTVMKLEHSGQTYPGFDVEWGVPVLERYGYEKVF